MLFNLCTEIIFLLFEIITLILFSCELLYDLLQFGFSIPKLRFKVLHVSFICFTLSLLVINTFIGSIKIYVYRSQLILSFFELLLHISDFFLQNTNLLIIHRWWLSLNLIQPWLFDFSLESIWLKVVHRLILIKSISIWLDLCEWSFKLYYHEITFEFLTKNWT